MCVSVSVRYWQKGNRVFNYSANIITHHIVTVSHTHNHRKRAGRTSERKTYKRMTGSIWHIKCATLSLSFFIYLCICKAPQCSSCSLSPLHKLNTPANRWRWRTGAWKRKELTPKIKLEYRNQAFYLLLEKVEIFNIAQFEFNSKRTFCFDWWIIWEM